MEKKTAHTVFRELQYIVQKWRVPIKGAEPGEQDRARIRVIEMRSQGERRVWQLTTDRKKNYVRFLYLSFHDHSDNCDS